MVERKAAAISTPVLLGVVSPHTSAIMPVLFTQVNRRTSLLQRFHIFSIDERFDISLLCALRVYGDRVDVNMP